LSNGYRPSRLCSYGLDDSARIAGAIRNHDNDRLTEGLLIRLYLGAIDSISPLAILMHFGVLAGLEDEEINSAYDIKQAKARSAGPSKGK
jgi:hypothetical protein